MQGQQKGFSLVEIMVGLVIGLTTMLVIMQVFADSEATKRTTSGGADAHTNGAISLYLLEREIRMAGWGLEPSLYLGQQAVMGVQGYEPGCTSLSTSCDGSAVCGGGSGISTSCDGSASCGGAIKTIPGFSFSAVSILDGGAGNPDTLSIRFFSNPSDENFIPSTNMEFLSDNNAPSVSTGSVTNSLTVASAAGCSGNVAASAGPPAVAASKGSLVLLSDPTNGACILMKATKVNPPVQAQPSAIPPVLAQPFSTIEHAVDGSDGYNPATAWPTTPTSSTRLSCITPAANGPLFSRIFSVDRSNTNLLKTDNTVSPAVADEPVAAGIFDLQAQYGAAADSSQNVTTWSDATGVWSNPIPKLLGASGRLQNIKAIRVAVLARSSQYEKPDSANKCQATTAAMTAKWPTWNSVPVFDTTKYKAVDAEWDCYRYKVFETLVPLRNVLWGNV